MHFYRTFQFKEPSYIAFGPHKRILLVNFILIYKSGQASLMFQTFQWPPIALCKKTRVLRIVQLPYSTLSQLLPVLVLRPHFPLFSSPSITVHQLSWLSYSSFNKLGMDLPQGLCSCRSLCLTPDINRALSVTSFLCLSKCYLFA